jgi:hypothetical protein
MLSPVALKTRTKSCSNTSISVDANGHGTARALKGQAPPRVECVVCSPAAASSGSLSTSIPLSQSSAHPATCSETSCSAASSPSSTTACSALSATARESAPPSSVEQTALARTTCFVSPAWTERTEVTNCARRRDHEQRAGRCLALHDAAVHAAMLPAAHLQEVDVRRRARAERTPPHRMVRRTAAAPARLRAGRDWSR